MDVEDPRVRDDASATAIEEVVRRLQLETQASLGLAAVDPRQLSTRVGDYLHGWSISSSDDEITSLALQIAAVEEFGIDAQPIELLRGRTSQETWQAAQAHYTKHHRLLRRALRRMYEITQEDLRDREVKELGVWRGIKELPADDAPTWLARAWAHGRSLHLLMQPLSSFTSDEVIARTFAGKSNRRKGLVSLVLRATIPAERVLSTAWTGLGTLREHELVVLATKGNVEACQC